MAEEKSLSSGTMEKVLIGGVVIDFGFTAFIGYQFWSYKARTNERLDRMEKTIKKQQKELAELKAKSNSINQLRAENNEFKERLDMIEEFAERLENIKNFDELSDLPSRIEDINLALEESGIEIETSRRHKKGKINKKRSKAKEVPKHRGKQEKKVWRNPKDSSESETDESESNNSKEDDKDGDIYSCLEKEEKPKRKKK